MFLPKKFLSPFMNNDDTFDNLPCDGDIILFS